MTGPGAVGRLSSALIRPVETNREVIMVIDWREELRRRTGGGK